MRSPATVRRTSARFVPGTAGFIVVLSACMSVGALGVDTVLPAYDEIRESLGLSPESTEITGLVTAYLAGNALGLLPMGLLADRFGRRPVMWGSLVFYIVFAVATIFAGSLALMIVARFFWGVASSGPRVAALAMVRDSFVGDEMAKQMSFVIAFFLLVPAVGPAISAGILSISTWQAVFWMCAGGAAVVMWLSTMAPETLDAADQRSLSPGSMWESIRIVFSTPGTVAFMAALTAVFASFSAYLSGVELIIDQTYDLEAWFPLFFGGTALVMLVAMVLNGRLVDRVGLNRLIDWLLAIQIGLTATVLVVTVSLDGEPPFSVFVVGISAILFVHQMMIPNLNSAAMRPLGDVAGTGTALLGMVGGVLGAVVAQIVNGQFDGTARPLIFCFFASACLAALFWRQADKM